MVGVGMGLGFKLHIVDKMIPFLVVSSLYTCFGAYRTHSRLSQLSSVFLPP